MLQCVTVCFTACVWKKPLAVCSVLQCVAVFCSVLRCFALYCSVLQCVCCSVLQCVAEYCSVLQCDVKCYSALQCVSPRVWKRRPAVYSDAPCSRFLPVRHDSIICKPSNTLQRAATLCNTLQYPATRSYRRTLLSLSASKTHSYET